MFESWVFFSEWRVISRICDCIHQDHNQETRTCVVTRWGILGCKLCVTAQELNWMGPARILTCSSQQLLMAWEPMQYRCELTHRVWHFNPKTICILGEHHLIYKASILGGYRHESSTFIHPRLAAFWFQIAKLGDVHVTATCGARNIALISSLGADEVLDYQTPEGAKLQSPSGRKYVFVLHCAKYHPFSHFKPQLSKKGKVIDLTPFAKGLITTGIQLATFSAQKFLQIFVNSNSDDLALLTNLINEGKLKTVVDSTFPLSIAEKAWEKQIEGHLTGKAFVTMIE